MRTSNLSLLNYLEYTILNRSMGYTYMRCTYRVGSMDVQGTRVSARVYLKIVQTIAFWSNSSGKEKKWELSDLSNRNVSNVARKKVSCKSGAYVYPIILHSFLLMDLANSMYLECCHSIIVVIFCTYMSLSEAQRP